jgi:hypothetical protein
MNIDTFYESGALNRPIALLVGASAVIATAGVELRH